MGFDVKDVRGPGMRYAADREIIEYAQENRRVVTRDLDFGGVLQYPNQPGAIILRLPSEYTAKEITDILKDFLISVKEQILKEAIIIVEIGRYRRRPLNPTNWLIQGPRSHVASLSRRCASPWEL